jgi:hypothetical protein
MMEKRIAVTEIVSPLAIEAPAERVGEDGMDVGTSIILPFFHSLGKKGCSWEIPL